MIQDSTRSVSIGPRYLKLIFPEDWNIVELGSLVSTPITYGVLIAKEDKNGVPMLRSGELESIGGMDRNIVLISREVEEQYKRTRLLGSELLISVVGYTGQVAIAPPHYKGYNISRHVAMIRLNQACVPEFYLYLIRSRTYQTKIAVMTSGSAQPVINLFELSRFMVPYPSKEEQYRIAKILSTVDDLIHKTMEIINQNRRLKKGLMQKLLTKGIGHKQFKKIKLNFNKEEVPQEWLMVTLGELCNINKINRVESELYVGLEHIGQGTNRLESKGNIEDFLSTTKAFRKGNVLYGKLRPLLNKVWLATEDGYCSTDILPLEPDMKVKGEFLLHILSSSRFLWYAVGTSAGTHMPRTNWEDIKNFEVAIPPLYEQERIISIIDGVNNEIQNLIEYKNGLETLKKGLAQRLLTGQIRVKV